MDALRCREMKEMPEAVTEPNQAGKAAEAATEPNQAGEAAEAVTEPNGA